MTKNSNKNFNLRSIGFEPIFLGPKSNTLSKLSYKRKKNL